MSGKNPVRDKKRDGQETKKLVLWPVTGHSSPGKNWLAHGGGNGKIDYLLLKGATMAQLEKERLGVRAHFDHLRNTHGLKVTRGADHKWRFDRASLGLPLSPDSLVDYQSDLDKGVKESLKLSPEEREKRLSSAKKYPASKQVVATVFSRNPDVIAAVRSRANGDCEGCGKSAPFQKLSDGTPYLEVHHKKRLADGGPDTVENAIALCPNCHRKTHFG
jgi:hypothetical protein